ncbi:TonB-dependent receptor [Chryseobacterium caseinilyticum]|uniref:Outer membrane beta-barrel protein n=1 Tax=Chryseobacterium caseinilyticum TaxID=2771428 RepID=A0ABR8ZA98_9FLAO|nr:TonB-dependent receptor [Chryseobacterium caseinilyticum]MBD8082156.1 outer membrane beta-barrel protein [Chryseobacterium caseinilyticum]
MRKILSLFFLLGLFLVANAQKISLDGKVKASDQKPLPNATVYLLKSKDSTIINYTSSNSEGRFSLKTDQINESSILKVEADKHSVFSKIFDKIDSSVDLGEITLEDSRITDIAEVNISASPVKIKKDTIEFKASAIKVRPDSKIEELLKNLPGVEISNEGKITVNGKEADQILINGKPFFDKDGKIALQNLPADIIKSIQFTTTKTKEEELNGTAAKSNNATINFTIDEKKNKGLISRLTAGYGSDERYEGSGLISYFKNDTKISLLASSNNINSQGFSNDEVFDSMGHGRNSWLMRGGSVVTNGNSTYYTQGGNNNKGIQRSTTIGLNYSDKFGKNVDLETLSLIHTDNDLTTRSKASRTTLLPDFTLKTNSESNGKNENTQYGVDLTARIKIDSLTNIYFSPNFNRTESKSFSNSSSNTLRDNLLLNENTSYIRNETENNSFAPNIYYSKKFKKKGRVAYANMSSTISENINNNLNNSRTVFYNSPDPDDIRNQLAKTKNQINRYDFRTGYTEPLSDSATVSLNFNYNTSAFNNRRNVNDFDVANNGYSNLNSALSYEMNQDINRISPEIGFQMNKKKINIWSSAEFQFTKMGVNSFYQGQNFRLDRDYVLPAFNLSATYNFSDNKRLSIYNYAHFDIPSAERLTPYEDRINPLISYIGNSNLKNTWTNSLFINLNNFNMVKNINYYLNVGFTYRNNDIVNYSYFDESGKQFITYANLSGNKNINAGAGFTKTFKWKDNKLSINPRMNINYSYNQGFINTQQFVSNVYSLNPGMNVTYEIKDKITIKPSYSLSYNFSNYENYSIDLVKTSNQILKMELTNYVFKSKLVIGNDFEYNTTSNIAPGFKRDFYFWNTSVGYSFFNKQLTAKVKVYDILNQNQSVRRTITNAYFEDREDLILKRYVMFSLTMKLNKFAGKKVKES